MNEEDLKNQVLVPFLQSCGLNIEEMEFERSFRIQLGRGSYQIGSKEAASAAGGRLDILCKRAGRNLMVAELKAPDVQLSDDDRKQGLSYARLLDPMAPYVVITNGAQTQLYDTITGKPVERISESSGYAVDLATEIDLRREALESFIGYSHANLDTFCRRQSETCLNKFRASGGASPSEQLTCKYIPGVFTPRKAIDSAFQRFLADPEHSVFAIVGHSGTGKTNAICHLVESTSYPSLFYSGTILDDSLLKVIAADFNLAFSSQDAVLGLLKKGNTSPRPVVTWCPFRDWRRLHLQAISHAKHRYVPAASTHCGHAWMFRDRMTHECLTAHT